MHDPEALLAAAMLRAPGRHEARLGGLDPDWIENRAYKAFVKVLRLRPMSFEGAPAVLNRIVKSKDLLALLLGALPILAEMPLVHDADVDNAAIEVAERAKRVKILDRSRWILESIKEGRLKVAEEAVQILAAELPRFNPLSTTAQGVGELARMVQTQYEANASKGGVFIRTGIDVLDDRIEGGKRGEMWLIAGDTGSGKTNLTLNIVYNAWLEGAECCWIPREMNKAAMTVMFTVRHSATLRPEAPLTCKAIWTGRMTPEQKRFYAECVSDIERREGKHQRMRFWQVARKWSIEDIAKHMEGERHRQSCDVLVVDMLKQLAPIRSRGQDPRHELNETLGEAKQFANSYNGDRGLWLLSPHQITRESAEKSLTRKPTPHLMMHDLAESSRAEQDSDVILWTLRTPALEAHNQGIIGAAKCRGDRPIRLGFKVMADLASSYFGNLAEEESSPETSDFDGVE